MSEPMLCLFSDSLLSKHGFNDGDCPDYVLDWLEASGYGGWRIDWHTVLCKLVEDYLVPVLGQEVGTVRIETSHNPVRARVVDGQDVEECWYNRQGCPELTPEYVEVPFPVVLGVALELGALESH